MECSRKKGHELYMAQVPSFKTPVLLQFPVRRIAVSSRPRDESRVEQVYFDSGGLSGNNAQDRAIC